MSADRPNVLVVLTDDHGQWAANCYGTPEIRSPNMDWLADTGARMANAFTPCPVCSPARACFYSGRFPSQHGVHDWLQSDLEGPFYEQRDRDWLADEASLYTRLHNAGYHVGHFGKWHIGADRIPKAGTDRWFAFWDHQGPHRGPWDYSDQGEKVTLDGIKSRFIVDRALDWLLTEDHGDRPWMMYVGMIDTHSPHAGLPERLVAPYRGVANKVIGTIDPPPEFSVPWAIRRKADVAERQAQYFASVTHLDHQLGRLIDAVDERGELDNTIIIYTGDHGLHAGQVGRWEKGNGTRPLNLYERSVRIPMLIRAPGRVQAGQVRDEFVDQCDLYETLLEWTGTSLDDAARAAGNYPGQSFAPMLAGDAQSWRDCQFFEYGPVRGVRSATHKLIRRNGSHGADQLFDVANDFDELHNVIDDPANAAVVADLDARLAEFFARIEDPQRSGLRAPETPGLFNQNEPWDPKYANHRCEGWPNMED